MAGMMVTIMARLATMARAAKIPKHWMAVMSETALARKAAAVVKLVTEMDTMACEKVLDMRWSALQPRVVKDEDVIGADGDEKQRCDEVDEREEDHLTHVVVEEVGETEAEQDVGESADDQNERTKVHEGKQSNKKNGEAEIFQVAN